MRMLKLNCVFWIVMFLTLLVSVVYAEAASEVWVKKYSIGLSSYADDVATDASGNVYVTGHSDPDLGTGWDIVTVKYDSSGANAWPSQARYAGPVAFGSDGPHAITVDASGNVYVTGFITGSGSGKDIVTIKYFASGMKDWDNIVSSSGDDYGKDIVVDAGGNVYVTGTYNGDYVTIKYNNSGGGEIVKVIDGGGIPGNDYDVGMAIVETPDAVYTTGVLQHHVTRKDFWTVKYNPVTLDTIWTRKYDTPGLQGNDIAFDITLDNIGNIAVTGESGVYPPTDKSCTTIKYDALGNTLWTESYDQSGEDDWGEAVVADDLGNVYVTGTSGYDFITMRLNTATGNTELTSLYGKTGETDQARDIARDNDGYFYVTGESFGDYATIMYDSDLNPMWTMRYYDGSNAPVAIAVMDSNHVYVTGTGDFDYTTIRYALTGPSNLARKFHVQLDKGPYISLDQKDPQPAENPDTTFLAMYRFNTGSTYSYTCVTQGWTSHDLSNRGDFAGQVFGFNTVQTDPCLVNASCMWAFINGSMDNYDYGGFPGQAAVPYEDIYGQFIRNEIWSPGIPWNTSIGTGAELKFDVYRDLRLRAFVFYTWRVRSWRGEIPGEWRARDLVYYGHGSNGSVGEPGDVDWFTAVHPFGDLVESNIDSIQVALGVWDMYDVWAGCYSSNYCHSHGPLFDNVHIYRLETYGPRFAVRDIDLFQDTFPTNGSGVGTGRIDMAMDVMPCWDPDIRPGDSACVWVNDPEFGLLEPDPNTGFGPAVYLYISRDHAFVPMSGPAAEGDGFRWPYIGLVQCNNRIWYQYRCDTVFTEINGPRTGPVLDRFCVDLNDNYFVNGDTLWFFFGAQNTFGVSSFWSQFTGTTNDMNDVCARPMEMQILPGGGTERGGDILYVDYFDGRGAEPYFETAFEFLGIDHEVDRYDKRGPSSLVNNGLGSRSGDVFSQLLPYYRKIIWNTGDLPYGNLGEGTGDPCKEDDAAVLYNFLHFLAASGGIYFSGDDLAEEWTGLFASAVTLKNTYIPFNLVNGNHIATGKPVSPLVIGTPGGIYQKIPFGSDTLVAYGGCPIINDFDVIEPAGASVLQATYEGTNQNYDGAIISKATLNAMGFDVRVVLSGFSFHYIRDDRITDVPDRVYHLKRTIEYLQNILDDPVGVGGIKPLINHLAQNYPNPFNPSTTIKYSVKDNAHVSLKIYNVAGQLVTTLVNEEKIPGMYTIQWNSENNAGDLIASGVYFYRMVTKDFTQTRKLIVLK